jgi:hypothetical protein
VPQAADADACNEVEVGFAAVIVQVHALGAGYVQSQWEGAGLCLILEEELAEMHGFYRFYIRCSAVRKFFVRREVAFAKPGTLNQYAVCGRRC